MTRGRSTVSVLLSLIAIVVGLAALAFVAFLIVTDDWRIIESLRDPRNETPKAFILIAEVFVGLLFVGAGVAGLVGPQKTSERD